MIIDAELKLVEAHLQQGRLDDATKRINALYARNSDHPDVLHAHAVVMWQTGNHQSAITSLDKAVLLAQTPVDLLLPLAQMHYTSGNIQAALKTMQKLVTLSPDTPDTAINLGALLIEAGQYAEACRHLQSAASYFPDNPDIYFNLGVAQKHVHKLSDTVQSYARAIMLNPENPQYRLAHANALIEIQAYDEALIALNDLDRRYPRNADVLERLAFTLTQSGNASEAQKIYQAFVEENPGNTIARRRLMYNKMQLGHWDDAAMHCQMILTKIPNDMEALGYRQFILSETSVERDPLYDIEKWLTKKTIEPPRGFKSLNSFNTLLCDEILTASRRDQDSPAISLHNGKIVADLKKCEGPAIATFVDIIEKAVAAYVDGFSYSDKSPWTDACPDYWETYIWSTILSDGGYQDSHMHPSAWLSGVYYVTLPGSLGRGVDGHAGWLEFGQPPKRLAVTSEATTQLIAPHSGLLLLFPSYLHHRTTPFTGPDTRVSIAFDCEPRNKPVEISGNNV